MRRVSILLVFVVIGVCGLIFGAAPDNNSAVGTANATETVDSSYDAGGIGMEYINGIEVTITDTANVTYVAYGSAVLDPGEVLRIYLCTETAKGSVQDSVILVNDVSPRDEKVDTVKWGLTFTEQYRSQTDLDDSAVIMAGNRGAVGSNTALKGYLINANIVAVVVDYDAS